MKIRSLWCAIFFGVLFFQSGLSQITNLDYQIRYNTTTCHWDCYIIINGGSATSASHRTQSNAQYSIVVPTGAVVTKVANFNPKQNNLNYTGTIPTVWSEGSRIVAPAIMPGSDFYSFTPSLNPTSWFNNLAAGDTIKLFSLNISPTTGCGSGIRIFRNGIDPPSSAPGMGGGDFSNGYTLGGIAQRYRANLPQVNPPAPTLNASTTCSSGIEIDLTASSTACLAPLTYSWQGPNGFTAITQDISINPSTSANNGQYNVTVTNARGCSATTSIQAISKPNAGNNINGCPSIQYNIQGNDPNTGSWSALAGNPAGATLTSGVNGAATVDLDNTASGVYSFRYNTGACSDTVHITANQVNAGDNPPAVSCYISGSASLAATGTGLWSLGVGSSGTANIANLSDPNTTVSGFSGPGTYFFVWTSGPCSDIVQLTVNDDCSCAITNNNLTAPNPSLFCGLSGNININGSNASPSGGEYLWIYSLNNGLFSAAPGTNNQQNYTTTNLGQGSHRFRRIYSLPSAPGCVDTSNVLLLTVNNTPATPTNLIANPNPSCIGQIINLSVTNIGGNTYTWTASSVNAGLSNSTSATATMNPVVSGTYSVTVTANANGCSSTPATVSVQVFDTPPTPNINTVAFTNPTVCNGTDGTISISGLAASTTYSINYTRNSVNQSANVTTSAGGVAIIIGLNAGTYANFVVVSANGCPSGTYAGPVNLVDPNAPAAPSNLAASPNPACANTPISLSVTNNPGATYTWSASSPNAGLGNSITNTNSMLPTVAGFYNINVTQTVAGCTSPAATLGVSVNSSPPTPTAGTVTSTNPTTCSGTNGSITLSGYLISTSYTVEYVFNSNTVSTQISSNGAGNIIIGGLAAGSYSNFKITNVSGCSSAVYPGPVVLTNPSVPAAPTNLTANPNPVCLGFSSTLTVTNTAGASYSWTASNANAGLNPSTSSSVTMAPTSAGSYSISVTQTIAGCTSPASTISVVVNPAAPVLTGVTGTNPTSCNGSNGIITISGVANFVTYTVNYLKNGNPVSASLTSNGSGQLLIIDLTSGLYTVFTVTTASNCTSNTLAGPVILSDPNAPSAPVNLAANPNPVCAGVTVNLSVTNNPGATYSWSASNANAGLVSSSGSATTMVSNVAATYTIFVTQTVGGCTSPSASVQVVVNPLPATPVAGQFTSTNPTICSGTDGSISISGLTANATFTINYSKNNTPQSAVLTANTLGVVTITNLTSGTYNNFRITNSNNCQSGVSTHSLNLIDPNAPSIPQNITAIPNPVCLGNVVNVSVTNTAGATYTWTASSVNAGLANSSTNTNSLTPTVVGSFVISVIQTIAGCTSAAATITVTVNANPPALSISNVNGVNPTSCGGNNGEIVFSGLVANAVYTLQYNAGASVLTTNITADASGIAKLTGLTAGTYSNFRITNAALCPSNTFTGPIILSDPSAPPAPSNLTAVPNPACMGVTVNMSATGVQGATFSWSASSLAAGMGSSNTNTNWLMPLSAGSYTITVTQSTGSCTSPAATVSVVINALPPTPNAGNFSSSNPSVCTGNDGSISISGYISNQTYLINYDKNGNAATANITANTSGVLVLTNLTAGVYSNFMITNSTNCVSGVYAGPVNLSDPNLPAAPVNLTANPNPVCLGTTVNLSVNNTVGATYTWTISSPNGGLGTSTVNTNVMNALVAGTFTVQVSQTIAGCTSPNSAVQVVVNDNPTTPDANTVSKNDPTCDLSNGSISILNLAASSGYTVHYLFNGSPRTFTGNSNGNGVITFGNLQSGQYTNFRLVNALGCTSGIYAGPVVLVNPGLPQAPNGIRVLPDFICVKNNVEISVNPVQGATYSWVASSPLAGLVPSSGAIANMVPTQPGLYSVSVTQTINGCTSPPATTLVEVRGDCFNPDFDVTYVNVEVTGDVSTNDGITSPFYNNIKAVSGNPSSCVPVLQNNGTYVFTCGVAGVYYFEINSCGANCESVPLVITVLDDTSNNKPPVVNHDYARTKMNVPVKINILANDKCQNVANCTLNLPTMVIPPTRGTYSINTGIYTPTNNFIGIDSFQYQVCQTPVASPVNCRRAWVYVTIISTQAKNITNAMDDYAQTPWNTPLNKGVSDGLLGNDTDPENDFQTVVPFSSSIPNVGSINVNTDGSYSFLPATGFFGPYFWTYQVCDDNLSSACDEATLHILVEPENLTGRIGNYIWLDSNGDGIQNSSENGMGNCEVRLYNDSGIMVSSMNTDGTGYYMFDNIEAGSYYTRVMTPANYVYSPPHVGDTNLDSDITGVLGQGTTNFFTVTAGENRMDIDAGLYECSDISGRLWYDYLKNDIRDNFENGLGGIFVILWRKVNGTFVKWSETTTGQLPGTASEDGYFIFDCVPPGEYYVEVDLPLIGLVRVRPNIGNDPNRDSDITNANGHMTTNTFFLQSGQNKSDIGGGFYPMATAGNLVWIDENSNGIQDVQEHAVRGVVVEARDAQTHQVKGTAVTNEAGHYAIEYLEKTDVYLKFQLPTEYQSYSRTYARIGDDAVDSDVDNTFGPMTTRAVAMEPGIVNQKIDMGIVLGGLPVSWVNVEVFKDNNEEHIIKWETANEINLSHYIVERSLYSADHFVEIQSLIYPHQGQNINKIYTTSDRDIQKSGVYYYRIKQVDLDGKYSYSKTVSIRRTNDLEVSIYPSPAAGQTKAFISLPYDTDVTIDLYDGASRFVTTLLKTERFEKGDHEIQLDLSNVKSGLYTLNIKMGDEIISEKLVVLDK
ncbi:MAG: cadherin-like domain-containing protein [Saprospiraceae bacterium]|nr:cadherin-like domain-containing protein [Saprospiraceae bacterium]